MNLIASADKNWAIGKNNELLIRIPDDMKQFRRKTTGNVVVMGRKTLESFPNQAPLKDRVNIVLTRNADYVVKGAVVVHSLQRIFMSLAVTVFMHNCWICVIPHTLQRLIMLMRQMPICRIWKPMRRGIWWRRAKNRRILM